MYAQQLVFTRPSPRGEVRDRLRAAFGSVESLMKTLDVVTALDHFACALLPVALQMNNGNMKDAVTDSY